MPSGRGIRKRVHRALASPIFQPLVSSLIWKMLVRQLPERFHFPLISMLKQSRSISVQAAGYEIQLWTSSADDHFPRAYLYGLEGWESEALSAWREMCTNADLVIDCGAYMGVYSIVAAHSGTRQVIAYEPNPSVLEKAQLTIQLNNLASRVDFRGLALSDVNGETSLLVPIGRVESSGAQIRQALNDRDLSLWTQSAKVRTVRLDDDVPPSSISSLSAIKIDAEGAELNVLRGAEKLLERFHPFILVELLSSQSLEMASTYLRQLGYDQPIALDGKLPPSSAGGKHSLPGEATNFLFIRK